MKYTNLFTIAYYFDFILSIHLNKQYNQRLLLGKYEFFDYPMFSNILTSNFIKDGAIDIYETNSCKYTKSYALQMFLFLSKHKSIDIKLLKSFINNFSKNNNQHTLKSGDNLFKSITNNNHNFTLNIVNGCAIIRTLFFIIENYNKKNCLSQAINITKILNNHPYEIIATYLLYITITYLNSKKNKNKNPNKLFKILINSLENISENDYKLILSDFDPKIFDKYKLEITANIYEFVRLVYGNFDSIPSERPDAADIFLTSKAYYVFISGIIRNNFKLRQLLIANNGVSVLMIAINTYIQFFYYKTVLNFVPLQNMIFNLVSVIGYTHHATIILSYFIYLFDSQSFIKKIPKNILNKITFQ